MTYKELDLLFIYDSLKSIIKECGLGKEDDIDVKYYEDRIKFWFGPTLFEVYYYNNFLSRDDNSILCIESWLENTKKINLIQVKNMTSKEISENIFKTILVNG